MAADPTLDNRAQRLFFVDHLRVALTILVVLHHVAVIYAANTPFYYLEPAYQQILALLLLVVFQLLNQAYFMGFFFLISGYFTPASFDRKGLVAFLRDRLLRLGIPMIAYAFLLGPLASIGICQMPPELTKITTPFTWQQYPLLIGVGPLWFAEMLLIFVFGYAGWRVFTRNRAECAVGKSTGHPFRAIGIFVLALAVASYLVRIALPLGLAVPVVGFPSLAYLPQYLSFFVLGIIAYRQDWLQRLPGTVGKWGLGVAAVATVVLFPVALSGKDAFLGRGTWESGVYALWDSVFSVGVCLGLITIFRRFFNHPSGLGRFLSRHAFTVYVVHPPVIVLLALALRGIHLQQLLKFGLAALLGVPLCFAVAFLVRKIPFASRVV